MRVMDVFDRFNIHVFHFSNRNILISSVMTRLCIRLRLSVCGQDLLNCFEAVDLV